MSLDDLSFIVDENPFIPQGREPLYARGLLAGLQGAPVIAAYLLIPQLENSLRHLLKQHGFIASKPEVIQDDYLLNKVLYSPDLKEVLTEDIILIIKVCWLNVWVPISGTRFATVCLITANFFNPKLHIFGG
jgi:hypothetical protein